MTRQTIEHARKALAKMNVECQYCKKEYNKGGLSCHELACNSNPKNVGECPVCQVEINTLHKKYCSQSCAASFNNTKRDIANRFVCLNCEQLVKRNAASKGKFCSNSCQQQLQWKETKNKLDNGFWAGCGKATLRRYLTETKGYCCSKCSQGSMWNGELLTLDVDHIDGDNKNNHPDNLRFLCPNCHTQTATWGKKKRIHGE